MRVSPAPRPTTPLHPPTLQAIARKHVDDPDLCSLNVFRLLDGALTRQVRDLRSAVVREGCRTIEVWATTLQDMFRPLAWILLSPLVELMGSGNKVITGCIHRCVKVMLSNCHVKNAVPIIAELLESRNQHVRVACYEYLQIILENYDTALLDKHVVVLESLVLQGVNDAAGDARAFCRGCFPMLLAHWPSRADNVFRRLDPRTQKQLEREGMLEPAVLADNVFATRGPYDEDDSVAGSPSRSGRSRSAERGSTVKSRVDSGRPETSRASTVSSW